MSDHIVEDLEQELRGLAQQLVDPRASECLLCFVLRALNEFGCDCTLRWSTRFRDLCAPRAVGLERRLGSMGGFCDCELFMNGYELRREHRVHDPDLDEYVAPPTVPLCRGVRRGSTQGCALWERQHRRW